MRDRADLVAVIEQYAHPDYKEFFLDLIRPSLRLIPQLEHSLEKGQSKFGGSPDLPLGQLWPITKKGTPYLFIAQLNLQEVASFTEEQQLPKRGMLYFFFCPNDWDDGLVLYVKQGSNLEKQSVPIELRKPKRSTLQKLFGLQVHSLLLKEASISYQREYYIPAPSSLAVLKHQKTNNLKSKTYEAFHEDVYENDLLNNPEENSATADHHLFGWYQGIQHECYQLYINDWNDRYKSLDLGKIDQGLEWKLLFQTTSDRQLNAFWGDFGNLYFFIHKNDLITKDFSKVRAFLDST